MFGMKTAEKVIQEKLHEAQMNAIENRLAAEYYAALAAMYEDREKRLLARIKEVAQGQTARA